MPQVEMAACPPDGGRMMHHLLELILWLLVAFIIGWIIGWFIHCVLLRGGRPRDGYVEQPRQAGQHVAGRAALVGSAVAVAGAGNGTGTAAADDGKHSAEASVSSALRDETEAKDSGKTADAGHGGADSNGAGEAEDDDPGTGVSTTSGLADALEEKDTDRLTDDIATAETAAAAAAPMSAAATSADAPKTSEALPAHGLSAPIGGKADDLQMISGIGPKLEKLLHELGIYHFSQIAAWTEKDIKEVDSQLKFKGRIEREEWVRQAKLLAVGKFEQFEKEYGTGGKKGEDGKIRSGTRTRGKKGG